MTDKLLNIILTGEWAIDESYAFSQLSHILFNMSSGHAPVKQDHIIGLMSASGTMTTGNVETAQSGSILRLRMSGVMTAADQLCSDGIQSLSDTLYKAYANDNIDGILLEVNSGGGESTAGYILKNALADKNKPVVVHAMTLGSAALLGTLPASEIIAAGESAKIGSIGSYLSVNKNFLTWYKENYTDIYATQSTDKNADFRSLIEGDSAPIQKAIDKSAKMFQDNVRKSRTLKGSEEKINSTLAGGMFDAADARSRGLVDGIGSFNYAMKRLKSHISYSK
jgi:protease-4